MLSYKAIQVFNVSTVGVVSSIAPLLVLVLAAVLLHEKIHMSQILSLLIVITGVCLVIGGTQHLKTDEPWSMIALWCLVSQPFMLAGGFIALRKMKQCHTMVLSSYVNLCLMIVSWVCVLCNPATSVWFFTSIGLKTWLLLMLSAFLTIADQTAKFIALKYQETSKL